MKFIRIHSLILHMARQGKARRTRGLSLEKALNSLLKFIIEILGAERREREREREREKRERERRERERRRSRL